MSEEIRTKQADGFSVSGDKPKPDDLEPTNVNPLTPQKVEGKNQKNS